MFARSASIVSTCTVADQHSPDSSSSGSPPDSFSRLSGKHMKELSADSGTGTLKKQGRRKFQEEIECEELLCEVADLRAALTDFSYRRPGPRQSAAAAALDTATTAVEAAAFLEKVGGKHGALQKFDQKLAAATAKSLVGRSSASGGSFLVGGHATAPVREPMMIII